MSSTSPGLREGQRRLIPKLIGESEEGHTKESARKKKKYKRYKGKRGYEKRVSKRWPKRGQEVQTPIQKKMKERRTRMRKAPGLVPGVRSQ